MKKDVRLYDLIFPIWLLIIFPITWIPVLAGNFLIDSIILLIYLHKRKIERKKEIWKKSIVKIFLFGLVGDIIGGLLMVGETFIFDSIGLHQISWCITYNPWGNIFALLYTLLCMAVSSFIIYKLDKRFAFNKTSFDDNMKKKTALVFSVFTTPILFLLPTAPFFSSLYY